MFKRAEERGVIHRVKVCHRSPAISHLLFANDTFFFVRATDVECRQVKQILHSYEEASGQSINYQKSSTFFSKHTADVHKHRLNAILGVHNPIDHGRYLDLPSLVGRNKKQIFAFLRRKNE